MEAFLFDCRKHSLFPRKISSPTVRKALSASLQSSLHVSLFALASRVDSGEIFADFFMKKVIFLLDKGVFRMYNSIIPNS